MGNQYMQQRGWLSEALCWEKEVRHKRVHSVWFYLSNILEEAILISFDKKQING